MVHVEEEEAVTAAVIVAAVTAVVIVVAVTAVVIVVAVTVVIAVVIMAAVTVVVIVVAVTVVIAVVIMAAVTVVIAVVIVVVVILNLIALILINPLEQNGGKTEAMEILLKIPNMKAVGAGEKGESPMTAMLQTRQIRNPFLSALRLI